MMYGCASLVKAEIVDPEKMKKHGEIKGNLYIISTVSFFAISFFLSSARNDRIAFFL